MIKGKVSVVRGTDRYITIAVDQYDDCGIKGVMFHWDDPNGIHFSSMMEMILNMDRVLDSMSCPRQTFQMRHFPGTDPDELIARISEVKERKGKQYTFRIYVQYRYHASWQGLIFWDEGDQQEPFESTLQMIFVMNRMLKGHPQSGQVGEILNTFHVAVDAYDSGRIIGNYQYIPADFTEQHDLPADLAETLGNFMKTTLFNEKFLKYGLDYSQLITNEACSICRRGGQKATFSIRIMFHEHCTWQGIIYWREGRVEQPFRSFKEMLYLMVSVVGTLPARGESYGEEVAPIAQGL